MPAGLRLFNEQGQEILAYTDRVTRQVNTITINDAGSVNVGDLKGGRLFWFFLPNTAPNQDSQAGFNVGHSPSFTASGSTLSWTYSTASDGIAKVSGTLIYGIY